MMPRVRKNFHDYADSVQLMNKVNFRNSPRQFVQNKVDYRFTLHLHPLAKQMTQKLMKSFSVFQDMDTEYKGNNQSMPFSVEVLLQKDSPLFLLDGGTMVLLTDVVGKSGGVNVQLAANMTLTSALAAVVVKDNLVATLIPGLTSTPARNSVFSLPLTSEAVVKNAVAVSLKADTEVTLPDGTEVTIPAGTQVLALDGTRISISINTSATLIRSKPEPLLFADIFSPSNYAPSTLVNLPYPTKDIDFTTGGAYSLYNWELFFHAPLMLAIHLSKNQQFGEAQRWFHFIFDPTDNSESSTPERFWKVRPFQSTDVKKLEEILVNLSSKSDPELLRETINSINAIRETPFRPHVVAAFRQQSYMYKTVMAYLDNLIAWADSLFMQDTGETIDEALNLYIFAANILGPKPLAVPKKGTVRSQTYANLRSDLDKFGNALRGLEPDIPFDLMPFPSDNTQAGNGIVTIQNLGKSLYFGVPRNEKLMAYWDTISNRLFKIHNSLNFQGIFRQLPLFEPEIDPGLLARAVSAGVDISAVVNGLNQPLPLVRFEFLMQKALELADRVTSLGNNLLSLMEKEDGEAMTILRTRHEKQILELTEVVRYGQWQEAVKAKEALYKSLDLAKQRFTFFEKQLGANQDAIDKAVPPINEIDLSMLNNKNLKTEEPSAAVRPIDVDIASDAFGMAARALFGGKIMSSHEVMESVFMEGAQVSTDVANGLSVASAVAAVVPQFEVAVEFWGIGPATSFGGQNISSAIQGFAQTARGIADRLNFEARRAARIDSFARRELEWAQQSTLAAIEYVQVFKQIRAAQIREAIAKKELENHQRQIKNAKEIEQFLNEDGLQKSGKGTNKSFYTWLKREIKGLSSQTFQLAFETGKKAERALQHELGDPNQTFLQAQYLNGKEGLLAGERLQFDLKRMEMTFHELNRTEYELSKPISILQVDPVALVKLRATGQCTVKLPETIFDMDGPGHYFRRIREVGVTIPCIAGPYTSVNCTVTLLKSTIRKSASLGDQYERGDDDQRFDDYFGNTQSIVTSSAQNDTGRFDNAGPSHMYKVFEKCGAESEWQFTLPSDPSQNQAQQFDYETISDVILHMRYTAREGGNQLRTKALARIDQLIKNAEAIGCVRLFSLRREFPAEWAKFKSQPLLPNQLVELSIMFRTEHFPYWSKNRLNIVQGIEIFGRYNDPKNAGAALLISDAAAGGKQDNLQQDPKAKNLLTGRLENIAVPPKPTGPFTLFLENNKMDDLLLAVRWSG